MGVTFNVLAIFILNILKVFILTLIFRYHWQASCYEIPLFTESRLLSFLRVGAIP